MKNLFLIIVLFTGLSCQDDRDEAMSQQQKINLLRGAWSFESIEISDNSGTFKLDTSCSALAQLPYHIQGSVVIMDLNFQTAEAMAFILLCYNGSDVQFYWVLNGDRLKFSNSFGDTFDAEILELSTTRLQLKLVDWYLEPIYNFTK